MLTVLSALMYATAPGEFALAQFNPNTLVGNMSAPTFLTIAGSSPSYPPCNPTENFKKPDTSTPAKVDPDILAPPVNIEFASTAEALG